MRKKINYYPITYGHVAASWNILYLISRYNGISPKKAVNIALQMGKMGGTFPAKQGLKICLDYDLVRINEDLLYLTEVAQEKLIPKCDQDDPNVNVIRSLLFHLISYHNFQWLIFYDTDSAIFREQILANDPEWVTLLDNAKLFDFEEEDVNIWWDMVLSKYEDNKNKIKKAIGDVGEKLTFDHELNRIKSDGFVPAKYFVKWASRISDKFGFDILSLRGKLLQASYNKNDKINIEVKASDSSNSVAFRFYISKPEWLTAQNNINSYYFYCWIGVNLDYDSAVDGPFIIPAKELVSFIPKDSGQICEWSECRCVMDISKYKLGT